MVTLTTRIYIFRHACTNLYCTKIFKRNYIEYAAQQRLQKRIHPYRQIHPWKSLQDFSKDLLNNIVYHKDGVIALNKPYGIKRGGSVSYEHEVRNHVPNGVGYTLEDALPYIRHHLQYPDLTVVRSPEKYTSGITLLAADTGVQKAIELAIVRTHFFSNTYWIVTVGVPKQLKNQHRLGIQLISNPGFDYKKAILTTTWSKRQEQLHTIKLFKTEYEVLSNSTLNLCSLIQIKASTQKRHAIRLFASTFLYCPVLGDNICASQIQKVGNTYVKVDPFLCYPAPPKLDRRLLKLLDVSSHQQIIIPAHVHLRSVFLPSLFGNDLTIEAPLMPPFDWTCKQLEFKYLMQNNASCK